MNGINSSIAGMNAAIRRLVVSANNIANSQTEDFKAQRAISGETTGGGVEIVEIQETPAMPEASGEASPSNVNLTTEITNQIVDSNTYEANAKMLKAQNDTIGTLLDIVE